MRTELFKEFLNFFWLRPENALLLALRAEVYRSTLDAFGDGSRAVDVSCGDGVFSFITLGGKLSAQTDMFRALDLSRKREGLFDAFDAYDDGYIAEVVQAPAKAYAHGTDWKMNLLRKAEKLGFYGSLQEHDNNKPLPFSDGSMEYVYTNSSYWVNAFEAHLADLARITAKGGRIVLEMKTSEITRFTAKNYLPGLGSTFHSIIDAGRLETWKGLRSKDEILAILGKIPGVKIASVKPIYGDIMAMIWDIGLRPLFRPLTRMANSLTPENRVEVKAEWCGIFEDMFGELLNSYRAQDATAIEYCITLEKI